VALGGADSREMRGAAGGGDDDFGAARGGVFEIGEQRIWSAVAERARASQGTRVGRVGRRRGA